MLPALRFLSLLVAGNLGLYAATAQANSDRIVVMISVDGERDTPAAMQSFLATYSPDFIGLTGDPRLATTIAAQFSAVFFKEPASKDGNYRVGHSGQVFVVDKQGRLRASFADASIGDMAKVLGLLIHERG